MVITGRVPLLLALGLLPVFLRPTMSTVWLWLLVVAAASILDWFVASKPQSLHLTRAAISPTRLGHEAESRLTVRNPGARHVRVTLRDAWQPSAGSTHNRHRLRLAARDQAVVRTALCPRRRGDLQALGVTARVAGPLGLAQRQATLDVPGVIRSLPPFESRKHLPSRLARLRDLDGRSAVRIRGAGTEFDSLREYVRGDDVRSIDWRASARNRNVVVRTWQPERDRRVVLVLDTSRVSAARVGDVPRLDTAMDAALLLAALAARAGDRVDFLAGDRRVRVRVRAAGARDIAARLQDAMADLQPVIAEADWSALVGEVSRLGRQRALVVLLTPLEPASVIESLLPVLPTLLRHHRVVVASVQDPGLAAMTRQRESLSDVYAAAAAARVTQQRRRAAEILGALGVHVVDADTDQLPPALADHYLALKARGLL